MKIHLHKIYLWFIERIQERSTWIGIISLLTTAGICINPQLREALIEFGISAAGVLSIITKG